MLSFYAPFVPPRTELNEAGDMGLSESHTDPHLKHKQVCVTIDCILSCRVSVFLMFCTV